jgi:hypothetical protein
MKSTSATRIRRNTIVMPLIADLPGQTAAAPQYVAKPD